MLFPSTSGLLKYLIAAKLTNTISITSSGDEYTDTPPSNILLQEPSVRSGHWSSKRDFSYGQYLQIELKEYFFSISSYMWENVDTTHYNMNWDMMASKNGHAWDIIDSHRSCLKMGDQTINVFNCNKSVPYKFFRIVNRGTNCYANIDSDDPVHTILYIKHLDLYGTPDTINGCTMNCSIPRYLYLQLFVIGLFVK